MKFLLFVLIIITNTGVQKWLSLGGATDLDLSSNCSMITVPRESVLKFHKCMQLLHGENIYQECFQLVESSSPPRISERKCHHYLIDDEDSEHGNSDYNKTVVVTVKCSDYQCNRRRSSSKLLNNKKGKSTTKTTYQYRISLLIELEGEEENETCHTQQTEIIEYELSKKKCPTSNTKLSLPQRRPSSLTTTTPSTTTVITDPTLENSNKIGLGYNPLYGNPVCYTGKCQMSGFQMPVFKLNYVHTPHGSCTTKLIPQFVTLDCLPSTETEAGTEIIDSLQRLNETTVSGIETNVGGNFMKASFSYQHSSETRYMIDNLIKDHTEALYTTAKISYIKLSSYEPFMSLSDAFRHAIEEMPCCTYSSALERYVFYSIFSNFGYTYVTKILLGGISLQTIFLDVSNVSLLEQKGISVSSEAQAEFYAKFSRKEKVTNDIEKTKSFMSHIKKTHSTTFGGNTHLHTLEEWSQSVKDNPVIIHFGVRYLFDLLTKQRFPSDKNINKKSKLIEQALNKYIDKPIYCYKECSGHGLCVDSGYFQFGICKCHSGWTGIDCSIREQTSTMRPQSPVFSGTLCGQSSRKPISGVISDVLCDGRSVEIDQDCPIGMKKTNRVVGFGAYCALSATTREGEKSKTGTICGLVWGSLVVLCNGHNPHSEPCPEGYQRGEAKVDTGAGRDAGAGIPTGFRAIFLFRFDLKFCYKVDDKLADDASGTICGMEHTLGQTSVVADIGPRHVEISCNGYYPGRGACPLGYTLNRGEQSISWYSPVISSVAVCSKN